MGEKIGIKGTAWKNKERSGGLPQALHLNANLLLVLALILSALTFGAQGTWGGNGGHQSVEYPNTPEGVVMAYLTSKCDYPGSHDDRRPPRQWYVLEPGPGHCVDETEDCCWEILTVQETPDEVKVKVAYQITEGLTRHYLKHPRERNEAIYSLIRDGAYWKIK
jgi:hypothetical protein